MNEKTNADPLRLINAQTYTRADLDRAAQEARAAAFKDAVEIIDTAADSWSDLARARRSQTFSAYVIAALDLKGQLNQAAVNSVKDSEQDA